MFSRLAHIKWSFVCSNFVLFRIIWIAEVYSEPNRTSKMEVFPKIVSGFQLLNIFASQMFENFSEYFRFFKFIQFVLPHKQGKLIITRKKNKNGTFNSLQKYKEKSREHPRQKQPPEVFFKKGVLKNFAKFTGKHLYHSLFSNNQVSSCEFCEISTPFLQNTSG